ncbi:hypothetical protein ACP70R_033942 [Stipagrostis hirtigluma subsp. patula]
MNGCDLLFIEMDGCDAPLSALSALSAPAPRPRFESMRPHPRAPPRQGRRTASGERERSGRERRRAGLPGAAQVAGRVAGGELAGGVGGRTRPGRREIWAGDVLTDGGVAAVAAGAARTGAGGAAGGGEARGFWRWPRWGSGTTSVVGADQWGRRAAPPTPSKRWGRSATWC